MAAYMLRMQSLSAWKEAGMGLLLGERWVRAAEEKHGRMQRERERWKEGEEEEDIEASKAKEGGRAGQKKRDKGGSRREEGR